MNDNKNRQSLAYDQQSARVAVLIQRQGWHWMGDMNINEHGFK